MENINIFSAFEIIETIAEMNDNKNIGKEDTIKQIIHLTAKTGITVNETLEYFRDKYNLDEGEIETVASEYESNDAIINSPLPQLIKNQILTPDARNSPLIPSSAYANLPDIISESVEAIEPGRQRDMLLISILTVLSGCLKEYSGLYDGKIIYPNLYSFIVAPAASGKGVMDYAKKIGRSFHDKLIKDSNTAFAQYEKDLSEYNRKKNEGELDEEDTKPERPPMKRLFVPGNSSTAALVEKLSDADGRLVIFETEADSLSSNSSNPWAGGFSEILRCGFHHESVSSNRKGHNNVTEIAKPKLSVSLSGTESQVTRLMQSTENGLYSRFIYYTFDEPMVFRDVSPNNPIPNKDDYYESLSERVKDIAQFYEDNNVTFNLSIEQWEHFNQRYRLITDYYSVNGSNSTVTNGIISRNGVISYRIAMILTALRQYAEVKENRNQVCNDIDFATAITISETLLTHSFITLNLLPKAKVNRSNISQTNYLNRLPKTFSREDATNVGSEMNLSKRSCDGYLKKYVDDGKIEKVSFGQYAKL